MLIPPCQHVHDDKTNIDVQQVLSIFQTLVCWRAKMQAYTGKHEAEGAAQANVTGFVGIWPNEQR